MKVDSCCEFGYELQLVIPYAYYLHTQNRLTATTSCKFTKELYYFSPDHTETYSKRSNRLDVPNTTPHVLELQYDQWCPPPYKEIFKNSIVVTEKPLLIIHNKYTTEWGEPPVNFINKATLAEICRMCSAKYSIVYIRPATTHIVGDNQPMHELGESDILAAYNVIDGNALYSRMKDSHSIRNFNHFQLLLHANCEKFISVQGGNCVLASYFGGTNIIYAKRGSELIHKSYEGHYRKYSGCNILYSNNYTDFLELIRRTYL